MADNPVQQDQWVIIKVEGMHCHKCEQTIQRALRKPGVHEVEVDFLSGQTSVLFDPASANISELVEAINDAGYRVTGFAEGDPGHAANPSDKG